MISYLFIYIYYEKYFYKAKRLASRNCLTCSGSLTLIDSSNRGKSNDKLIK